MPYQVENLFENCLFRYRNVIDNNISALKSNRLYFSTLECVY